MTAPRHLSLLGVPSKVPAYIAEERAKYLEAVARGTVDPDAMSVLGEWDRFAPTEPTCDKVHLNAVFPSLPWWISLLRTHAGRLAGQVRTMLDRSLALDEMLRVGDCQLILDYDRGLNRYRCHVHIRNGEPGGEEISFSDTRLLSVLDQAIQHTGAKGLDARITNGEYAGESDDDSTISIRGDL